MDRLQHWLEDLESPTCPNWHRDAVMLLGAHQICAGNQSASVQLSDLPSVCRIGDG